MSRKIDISVILRSHTYRTSNKMQCSMHCSFHRISISWLEVAILLRRLSKCFHCMMEFEIDRQYPIPEYVFAWHLTKRNSHFTIWSIKSNFTRRKIKRKRKEEEEETQCKFCHLSCEFSHHSIKTPRFQSRYWRWRWAIEVCPIEVV